MVIKLMVAVKYDNKNTERISTFNMLLRWGGGNQVLLKPAQLNTNEATIKVTLYTHDI